MGRMSLGCCSSSGPAPSASAARTLNRALRGRAHTLGPRPPIGQHAPLARPAALHRRGHALIAAVQAAAPRGQETAFAPSVVGKPVRSVVSNHRAPVRGRLVGVIYPIGARSARRVAVPRLGGLQASPAAAAPIWDRRQRTVEHRMPGPAQRNSLLRPPLCGST